MGGTEGLLLVTGPTELRGDRCDAELTREAQRDGWYAGVLPDRITIFRGPILRRCATYEEIVEEVRVTVVHEVAHHFCIDDDELADHGSA